MPDSPIRIKRYPNRRYYASHTSSYLSLAEIEELVRNGHDVEIVDSQSGEDLTRGVLLQMIAENHPDKMAMIPSAMLHAMLRANDVMTGFLRDYFRNALSYLEYLHRHGSSEALVQPVHWMKAWLETWSRPLQSSEPPPDAPPPAPPGDEEHMAARLRELEERIQQLEHRRDGP
ncbi:MAG TPA: polyhydroxyalkanoate synthesis regulator DNA-binding domain-containing protein [Lacipirellulaceae bacterium]|nr:polyhydroxyalkanoate synthesis regulator DNA-binding domain-containing protein [Lacipirellulaceae bacterium]